MDTIKTIINRHSVREFSQKKVKISTIKHLIEIAQHAPSWVNSQPWRVYVAVGETLKKIKLAHIENYEQGVQPHSDFPTRHRQDWDAFPREHMAQTTEYRASIWNDEILAKYKDQQKQLYDAPALIYITIPKDSTDWSKFDAGSFVQTLLLAAKDKGISSIPAYEIAKFPDTIRKIMGISNNETIAIGVAIGYPKDDSVINAYHSNRILTDQMMKIKD